ncbi:sigma-70 family RNA polymerase sigma factor [Streptomyces sp. NPDC000345]|uniref:sigma-70 family RNA polymerase sigma factor n=1 Tax=Streptomyces sp. NPDC000345 TaxID=3364537 RepID=UPI0036AC8271
MRAALGDLLVSLRRAAVGGVVPERVFAQQVAILGLGETESARLRDELARLGLPVRDVRVHTDADSPDVEKVARKREESVSPRGRSVLALLARYTDTDGYVTSLALDGVIRLAGLTVQEAAELRGSARVKAATGREDEPAAAAVSASPAGETGGGPENAKGEPSPDAGGYPDAVEAALGVLRVDRVQRRPENRILGAEAEVGLAVLVRGGADSVAREPEEAELTALPPGDLRIRARDCLVLHNQRLVHALVRGFLDQGLEYDDLFQHGVLGLMRAARKFDPTMGNKFSTYATWWVRQSITRAIADEGALIRIPVHMHEQMRKVAAAERALAAQGRTARAAEVAVHCDISVRKVEEIRKLSRRTDSLDRVIGDGTTLGDLMGEHRALPSVEQDVVNTLLMADVMAVVDTFSERSARVLVRRLGLDGDEPSTLDELGREYGVTRERIRQIESKALPEFRLRLRRAGVISAYPAGGRQEADGDGEQGRSTQRRARAKDAAAAVVGEPRPDGEPEARPEVPSVPPRDQERPSRTDEETAVAEESGTPQTEEAPDAPTEPEALTAPDAPTEPEALTAPDAPTEPEVLTAPDAPTEPEVPGAATGPDEPSPPVVAARHPASAVETGALRSVQYTADWDKALRISATFAGGIDWLAEYALLALGHAQLTTMLGSPAAMEVVRAVRERKAPDQQVLAALEVLQRVFDTVKEAGLRPEDFFERPAEALVGVTPRAYLSRRPLVRTESRLALRDALREFAAETPSRREAAEQSTGTGERADGSSANPPDDHAVETAPESDGPPSPVPGLSTDDEGTPAQTQPEAGEELTRQRAAAEEELARQRAAAEEELARLRSEADRRLAEVRREHETQMARARHEHQRRLTEERQAADTRVAAAEAETERQLDALEETLLHRVDRALIRQERHLRGQTEERIARLREEHREAQRIATERAERAAEEKLSATQRASRDDQQVAVARLRAGQAEQRAALAEQRAALAEQRAYEGDRRLRRYREEAEARTEALEERLRLAEAELSRRDDALVAARRETAAQVEAAERRAAQRIAQAEHDAWARIGELQEQLAAERAAAVNRTSFRDRWRRS